MESAVAHDGDLEANVGLWIDHQPGGDHLPFKARSVRYRYPNFLLDLPPDTRVEVLLRVQSQSSMQVPLALYTPTSFIEISRDAQFGIGLYYGILLALFVYNLLLWLSLRDASYFWYLFHLSAFGLPSRHPMPWHVQGTLAAGRRRMIR